MEHKLYNLDKMRDIAAGDEEFVQEMLLTFFDSVGEDIDLIKSYQSNKNWDEIAKKAHKLTSNFAYFNSLALQKQAAEIEVSIIKDVDLVNIYEKTEKLIEDTHLLLNQMKDDFVFLQS